MTTPAGRPPGITILLQRQGWRVTYVTLIGDHYRRGGGRKTCRTSARQAAAASGVEHVLLDHKSMPVHGADARMAHNPDTFPRPGRHDNYNPYYPTLGLCDSLDPEVLEHHARWAVEASPDGLIWDYMVVGEDNPDKDKPLDEALYDRSMRTMLEMSTIPPCR